MSGMTRREFLEMGAKLALVMGLAPTAVPRVAEAVAQLASGAAPVLWLQAQSCSGCSVSLLDAGDPSPVALLTKYLSVQFHPTLSTATGHTCLEIIKTTIDRGGFFLVVEGAIPQKMPEACWMGEQSLGQTVAQAARQAKAVVALGACAAYGGIPGAPQNPTGAVGLPEFFKSKKIKTPTILIPGCPSHPDWLVGTLVHLLKFGMPALDSQGRPRMFFSKLIHDQCPRFPSYEREQFAKTFGEDGCLFKLGCLGPNTHADCTLRYWNHRVNTCIAAGAPCIGCASEYFAKIPLPFYLKT